MYEIEVKHEGLKKYRVIKGSDPYVVEQKARYQKQQWNEMWKKRQEAERKRAMREAAVIEKEEKKAYAIQLTNDATEKIKELDTILISTLGINDALDWEKLKDTEEFPEHEPDKPKEIEIPESPKEEDEKYRPKLGIFDSLIKSKKEKKISDMRNLFKADLDLWEKKVEEANSENEQSNMLYEEAFNQWLERQKKYREDQAEKNKAIDNQRENYEKGLPTAIIDYCDMVLSNSLYPDYFPQKYDIDYNPETKLLIVDYSCPSPDDLPNVKEVKYIQSRDELKESYLSAAAMNKMYDSVLYQITLRSLHELFEADVANYIDAIVFNGWVESIDKALGKETNSCILSIQVSKEEFLEINLSQVDPKLCFKNLKGIGSSKLNSLTPIAPIIKIDRDDPRFVSSYDVTDSLDETDNLAVMDWQDFEHLIRELFEKEFNQSGGEVKITRASKDGGVDAVAFDPDPIRGGKIVIQAKRYTNVVGVSAVRDLYGTVMNEGATKGILVSTADYGPDAYNFAKAKPLTLLNGNNLLHLLQKHGHRAKIDLKEAKKIIKEREERD
ncbi:restriction endonuclease [Lederbergia galactosidilytica]|uniref:Restriction endonuclease n=1 Tax=Lederbergia galactosidilytica TaxID=217031 RepID=A0A178A8X0_9BACI|nr:restriction endonuclease [Lederbergia galactosidilytica]OAK75478.1 restriction endonuclease [Lederbergia galactosidilytica]